jgi:hypothetical protein
MAIARIYEVGAALEPFNKRYPEMTYGSRCSKNKCGDVVVCPINLSQRESILK